MKSEPFAADAAADPAADPASAWMSPAAARGEPWPFDSAVTGLVDLTFDPIELMPVPRLRRRRNGWTEETQRTFMPRWKSAAALHARRGRSARPRAAPTG